MEDVTDAELTHLAPAIRDREISPLEVVRGTLARIDRLEGRLHSFITVAHETALAAARIAETEIAKGHYRGPLHGVPIALKDVIRTAGLRTTNGSKIFADCIPDEDAEVVKRLKNAGAIIVGKNNMHELAMGSTTANPYFGACSNPWNLGHVPGGSSGGSAAAVAARLCFGAIATDTAGSIRSPASQCGVVGLKPTAGLVSRDGIFTVSPTLDHVGPIARTTRDAALILHAIAERPTSPATIQVSDLKGLRIGVPTSYFFETISAEVEKPVRDAIALLAELGAEVVPAVWPKAAETAETAFVISAYEAARQHEKRLTTYPEEYSPELRERLESGMRVSSMDYGKALAKLSHLRQTFSRLIKRFDLLAAPTNPVPAPRHGETNVRFGGESLPIGEVMPRFNAPQNATGCPALSVPCGFTPTGLPVGLQLVAASSQEATLLHVGAAYENATPWHARRPPLVTDA